jgi:hypothetical protein
MPGTRSRETCESSVATGQDMMRGPGSGEFASGTYLPGYGETTNGTIMKTFVKECQDRELPVIEEELGELDAFLDFLTRHVTTVEDYGVSCMLLWSEWVKFCIRRTQNYPGLIYEQEFRYLIVHQFKLQPGKGSSPGLMYPGLKFVPDKNLLEDNSITPLTSPGLRISPCS